MKRKLIRQGGGGYTLYLPKKWVDSKGLKAGDQVDVTQRGTALFVDSAVQKKKEITLELNPESSEDIKNILTHIYRRGFESITLKKCDSTIVSKVRKIAQQLLLGFEMTQADENKCVLENISEPTSEKYDTLLRRCFLIIKETHTTLHDDIKKNKFENLKNVEELRINQDKYILFCRRIIVKQKLKIEHPILSWELLTFLMHIEHSYHYLYAYMAKNKIQTNKHILELLDVLEKKVSLHYDAFYKKDLKSIHKINLLKSEYQFGKCYEYIKKAKGNEAVVLSKLRELFRLIQISTSPMLSLLYEEKIN